MCKRMGFSAPYLPPGPLPSFDHWDTIRKLRSCYSKQVRASAIANSQPYSVGDDKGKNYQRLARDPCGLLCFLCFVQGCKRRMGQNWRPNRAIGVNLMRELLAGIEDHMKCAENDEERDKWIMAGGYFCFCYVTSL